MRVHLPEDVLPIWCNPTEILQVIVNLVINACDAGTKDNPATVEIAAMPRETDAPARHPDAGFLMRNNSEFVLFKITDTGTGITEDVRERIFQRNFTTKGSMGTGLGLPIVARILQDNRAALWVDTLPGSGTTMTVAWPSKPAVAEAARAAKLPQGIDLKVPIDPTLLKGLQALVVDDLPDVALVLASMLEAGGAEVYCETDPEFVKEVLADAPSDWSVLVTDLHMPGTDGAALARFAATLNPPVPVVLVTARTDTLDEVSLRDFAAVLQKPVSGAQLVNAVLRAAASQEGIRQERSSQGTSSD
ncbi:hybrid sensor histidine kinase/response regulator [Roseicyclus mahoneyensis]|uniref:hybrid sensor histidine kinase/response regulator n=1 Tax=Roseicyclus mahoneyensis TaxID=164332 RepID=UPI0024821EDE|nr:hybrid sensor histidine kinase/response regulator [Roseicyclus mahoneyensis]